jgi:hypothetical protein
MLNSQHTLHFVAGWNGDGYGAGLHHLVRRGIEV